MSSFGSSFRSLKSYFQPYETTRRLPVYPWNSNGLRGRTRMWSMSSRSSSGVMRSGW